MAHAGLRWWDESDLWAANASWLKKARGWYSETLQPIAIAAFLDKRCTAGCSGGSITPVTGTTFGSKPLLPAGLTTC